MRSGRSAVGHERVAHVHDGAPRALAAPPSALHAISDALPLSYAVDGMHHLSHQSGAAGAAAADIAIVLGFALAALVLGAATLRRRTD